MTVVDIATRKDNRTNMGESFTYDDMNRLTGITLTRPSGQDLVCSVTYDALGRMTSRQAVTSVNGTPQVTTVFSQPVFDNAKVHALTSAATAEGVFPSDAQSITHTGFDKVAKVVQGDDSVCFAYGHDRRRNTTNFGYSTLNSNHKMQNIKKLILYFLLGAMFTSCSTEVDLYADGEEILIIYGILDSYADTNYIKITHSLKAQEGALSITQDPLQSNYPGKLDVRLTEFCNGDSLRQIILDTITIHNKQEGLFYASDLYR